MDLFNNIQELILKLNNSISLLSKYDKELADAERDYKMTLRQEALKLRNDHKGHINIDDLYIILQKGSDSNE